MNHSATQKTVAKLVDLIDSTNLVPPVATKPVESDKSTASLSIAPTAIEPNAIRALSPTIIVATLL